MNATATRTARRDMVLDATIAVGKAAAATPGPAAEAVAVACRNLYRARLADTDFHAVVHADEISRRSAGLPFASDAWGLRTVARSDSYVRAGRTARRTR